MLYYGNILIIVLILIILIFIFNIINKNIYIDDTFNENYENQYFEIKNDKNIDIIIARYNEDLEWTLDYPFNQYQYIVYNKGDNEDFVKTNVKKIIKLPNVGKCDHTYLYHIIDSYDNLANITVFFPGSVDMKYKRKIAIKLLKEMEKKNKAIFISLNEYDIKNLHYDFKLDNYKTTYKKNIAKNSESILKKSNIRPYGPWFEKMFGNIKINCLVYYGIFSIDKKDIIQHPKKRYQKLIEEVDHHSNPEAGHYFERSWCAVFHPLNETFIIKYNKF